jgi:hypothetical protein
MTIDDDTGIKWPCILLGDLIKPRKDQPVQSVRIPSFDIGIS